MKKKFVREHLGPKKLTNMKKDSHQFVIDGFLVDEVLSQIPNDIKIIQSRISCVVSPSNTKIVVPNKLRKLGVEYMRTRSYGKEIIIVMDEAKPMTIKKNVDQACQEAGVPRARAFFQYIVLSNGEATGKFEHCTKEINPDETDLRKKLRVLGLVTGQGPVQGLISQLGAKKYLCQVREETVRLMMCSKA